MKKKPLSYDSRVTLKIGVTTSERNLNRMPAASLI